MSSSRLTILTLLKMLSPSLKAHVSPLMKPNMRPTGIGDRHGREEAAKQITDYQIAMNDLLLLFVSLGR